MKRMLNSFLRRFTSRGIVLAYHRIADLDHDPQLLAVSPRNFGEHLEAIRNLGAPLALTDLGEALRQGRVPRRAIAVTFDDGYVDNVHQAAPALERAGIPATFFVTSGKVGSRHEFWWDEVERLLLVSPELPETLELDFGTGPRRWSLRGATTLSRAKRESLSRWNVLHSESPTQRHTLYKELCDALRRMLPAQREAILAKLRAWSGDRGEARPSHRAMTASELGALSQIPVARIGAHGVDHPMLSVLDPASQRAEIASSREFLEETTGRPVDHFAYPFGSRTDYTADTVRLVSELGFTVACANFPETVTGRSSVFEIPRFVVRNWNGQVFRSRIQSWLHG
jgi:peptidoglycan/xylan/chitin deacetylase (PgdA/CDA1 family)